jgi:thiol-disulfide isomerase/thioredoxin
MEDINGVWHQLKYIKAEYIIIAFWEPDCGHCKKEIPKLHEYYKTVRDSGVVVMAVYTQHDKDEWKKFVEEKQLDDWINVGINIISPISETFMIFIVHLPYTF